MRSFVYGIDIESEFSSLLRETLPDVEIGEIVSFVSDLLKVKNEINN
jgi:hypothetical protein